MVTKVVNGKRIQMTPAEVDALETSRVRVGTRTVVPTDEEVYRDVLKTKGLVTDADLTAAKTRLTQIIR